MSQLTDTGHGRTLPRVCASVLLLAAMACGGSSTSPADSTTTTTTTSTTVTPTAVAITGTASLTLSNLTSQLTATATMSDSTTQDVSTLATWQASNTAVATVSATGLVTAVADGSATVSATYESLTGTIAISVSNVGNCPAGTHNHGSMTATINGVPWKTGCVTVAELTPGTGVLHIRGADNSSLVGQGLDIQLSSPTAGTFLVVPGAALMPILAQLQVGGSSGPVWSTESGSGAVTVITLTATGASGTFTFSLPAATSSATGTKVITNGAFDVTF